MNDLQKNMETKWASTFSNVHVEARNRIGSNILFLEDEDE